MEGWISLHRKIKEHWLWKDPVKLKWWLDILLTVNNAPNKVNIGNHLFDCARGQSVRSLQSWAEQFKTSKDSTRNFFKLLEKDGMIVLENLTKTTRLTVCKYDSYQTSLHDKQTQAKRKPNARQTQTHPNNKEDKDNNEDNKIPYRESVLLFDAEYTKLIDSHGKDKTEWMLDKLNNAKLANTKLRYASDYRAILNWVVDAAEKSYSNNKTSLPTGSLQQGELRGMVM